MAEYFNPEAALKSELAEQFPDLTLRQVWTIVKLSKRIRQRARNNAAFNNLMNRLLPNFEFREVPKDNKWGKGLQITDKKSGDNSDYEGEEE